MPDPGIRAGFAAVHEWSARRFDAGVDGGLPELPLSFRHAGAPPDRLPIAQWAKSPAQGGDVLLQETVRASVANVLEYTCRVKRYVDYPAVEWVVEFANRGDQTTEILSDILPLDVLFELGPSIPCRVHHARGALTQTDDFEPLVTPLTFRQGGSTFTLSARTGKSSTLHLPFFNLEMGNQDGQLAGPPQSEQT